jgi:hypothetical protein
MSNDQSERPLVSFDWAIKYLLRDKSDYVILEGFLNALFQQEIVIEEILESASNPAAKDDKQIVVDLLCKTKAQELVLIEVQFARQQDFFQRILYSTSKMLAERLKKGEGYHKVVKIYTVCLVYFNLGLGEDYVYQSKTQFIGLHKKDVLLNSKSQQARYKKMEPGDFFPEFYILKVDAFKGPPKTQLDEWLYYFKNVALPENHTSKSLTLIAEKFKSNNMKVEDLNAYKKYHQKVTLSKTALKNAYSEGVFEGVLKGEQRGLKKGEQLGLKKGEQLGLKKGEQRGLKKGLKEGIEAKTASVILKAYQEGLSVATIAKLVALPEGSVIKTLKNNNLKH